jgi:hypothetical protein
MTLLALLPSVFKGPLYRIMSVYKIGKRVKIRLTILDTQKGVVENANIAK